MEQGSTKNRVVLVKTYGVSKYRPSVQKIVIHKINIKAHVKTIIPSLF